MVMEPTLLGSFQLPGTDHATRNTLIFSRAGFFLPNFAEPWTSNAKATRNENNEAQGGKTTVNRVYKYHDFGYRDKSIGPCFLFTKVPNANRDQENIGRHPGIDAGDELWGYTDQSIDVILPWSQLTDLPGCCRTERSSSPEDG